MTKSSPSISLFCVHAVMGTVFSFIPLAKNLEEKINFVALQSPQLSDSSDCLHTLEKIAHRYILSLKKQQAQGPYFIAGWSFGGLVAYEIARQLIKNNEQVAHLFIIDMAIQSNENSSFSLKEEDIQKQFLLDLKQVLNKEVQADDKEARSLLAIFQNHIQATKHYFTQLANNPNEPLNCPSTIFAATEGIMKSCDDKFNLGWGPYLTNNEVIRLTGDHYSILKSPDVNKITQHLIYSILNENNHEN